jgi:hypothetical protein
MFAGSEHRLRFTGSHAVQYLQLAAGAKRDDDAVSRQALPLAGCVEATSRSPGLGEAFMSKEQLAAKDDAICQGYGAKPGSDVLSNVGLLKTSAGTPSAIHPMPRCPRLLQWRVCLRQMRRVFKVEFHRPSDARPWRRKPFADGHDE